MEIMDKKEFEFLLKEGEGQFIEFKENLDSKGLAKEIVAFANSQGGKIFLGISDDGKIKGFEITNKLKSEIQDIARNCDPSIKVKTEQVDKILIVEVEEGTNKPFSCSQGFYLRSGASSQKLSRDEILDFSIQEGKIKFDEQLNDAFNFKEDFDEKKLDKYLGMTKLTRNIPIENILSTLNVVKIIKGETKFNNAGILLFSKEPSKFFLSSKVICVNYKTNEKVDILDKKIFDDGIINNIEDAIAYVKKHIDVRYEIKTAKRKEISQFPEEAFREAIVNSVIHRDYFDKSGDILIEIFKNKIIVSNPGGLVKWLKPEDFGKYSRARNQIIADVLSRTIYVEKVGSGINRIKEALSKAGLPAPIFEYNTSFAITIFDETGGKGRVPDKVTEKVPDKVTENQRKILDEIKKDQNITSKLLAELVGISERKIKDNLAKLKQRGLIDRIGPDKGGHWEIKE